jgi:hypothetical protein
MHIVFKNYLKRHLDGKNYFPVENIQVTEEGEFVNHFVLLQQYVFHITKPRLTLKAAELNNFPHTFNKDRNCWYRFIR